MNSNLNNSGRKTDHHVSDQADLTVRLVDPTETDVANLLKKIKQMRKGYSYFPRFLTGWWCFKTLFFILSKQSKKWNDNSKVPPTATYIVKISTLLSMRGWEIDTQTSNSNSNRNRKTKRKNEPGMRRPAGQRRTCLMSGDSDPSKDHMEFETRRNQTWLNKNYNKYVKLIHTK